ncbi:hypothetical protein TRFO_37851 [Tritrichomonas foetus]|uniref:Uncharacterized protein n=1 Tax=Tritrichomonas foetus TaxID=1144522 RepID=A0A1J4JFI6_9EUKA|nr:hypothetical protein TRFO_37851 [Tritrichomonas foetus]|eukprot:OHS95988.1 hypothetical protein TRFO_37851 [Tritrichomonas foetus]
MGVHIKLIRATGLPQRDESHNNPISQWKNFYRPPWVFLFHMIQVFCFIWIYLTIINPTVTTLYQIRDMLITHFLPDREDKIPFSSIDILQNSIEDCLDNIEKIYKDSFQNFYFSDSLHPVIFNIYWLNGSVTQSANIELTQSFFHHILSFDLTSKFMLMIEEGEVIG